MKEKLLFYNAYEEFYDMARNSESFGEYCASAFGEDFSQDGFSDISQINLMFNYIPKTENLHILDIGCGNGKMVKYLQDKVGGSIFGFDFSENAINTACGDHRLNAQFKVGVMGEIDYPKEMFDFVTSMDTMYFARDMNAFVGQVH